MRVPRGEDPEHAQKHSAAEPGDLLFPHGKWRCGAHREVQGRTPMMHEREKSDRPAVPTKSPNKAGQPTAEEMEGRGLAKRNPQQSNTLRIQGRASVSNRLERVRQAAQRDKRMKFTGL